MAGRAVDMGATFSDFSTSRIEAELIIDRLVLHMNRKPPTSSMDHKDYKRTHTLLSRILSFTTLYDQRD